MTKEQLIAECLKMPDSTVGHPYGPDVTVAKNAKGKSFANIGIFTQKEVESVKRNCDPNAPAQEGDLNITVKCPPELIYMLRDQYSAIIPGYYSNKDHWNTIIVGKDVSDEEIKMMIRLSHDLVTNPPKKKGNSKSPTK